MSGASTKKSKKRHHGGVIFAIVFGTVLVVLAGVYVTAYFMAGDRVPRNASVHGVEIGGLTSDEAVTTLQDELAEASGAELTVTAGDASTTVIPQDAGLAVDYEASVAQAGAGRSWDPLHLWQVLIGGGEMDVVLAIDNAKLDAAAEALAQEFAVDPQDAEITFEDNAPVITDAVDAVSVDPTEISQELRSNYLSETTIPVEAAVAEPEVTTAEAQEVVDSWVKPAVAHPIAVSAGEAGSFDITPAMIASAITFEKAEGTLVPSLDQELLFEQAEKAIDQGIKAREPKDAGWKLENGSVVVVPAVDGTEVTAENLYKSVSPVITKPEGERKATVELVGAKAKFTTEMAEKAKPTKQIGTYTTYFPHADYRNVNLGRVAELINGYVLRPGETFSMNDVVGRRTAENGFVDGYVIQGGVLKREAGGGVSQAATTIYNAGFFAGLEDVEHQPHTLYFDRYPAGREATVYFGSIDLRFKNDTDHGVIITASRAPSSPGSRGSMTVSIWGTSPWDEIRSPEPTRSGYYSGTTRTRSGADCEYQAPIQGFTASYYRAFIKNGAEAKRENYSWTYSAGDEIRCE